MVVVMMSACESIERLHSCAANNNSRSYTFIASIIVWVCEKAYEQ